MVFSSVLSFFFFEDIVADEGVCTKTLMVKKDSWFQGFELSLPCLTQTSAGTLSQRGLVTVGRLVLISCCLTFAQIDTPLLFIYLLLCCIWQLKTDRKGRRERDTMQRRAPAAVLNAEIIFLHIKPHNKDIYDHIRCSTALLWWALQSWELELVADVTASLKQRRHSDNLSKNNQRSFWNTRVSPNV